MGASGGGHRRRDGRVQARARHARARWELPSSYRGDDRPHRRDLGDGPGDRMKALALVVVVVGLWLALPANASAARVAVGLTKNASAARVAKAVEERTGSHPQSLKPIPALVV